MINYIVWSCINNELLNQAALHAHFFSHVQSATLQSQSIVPQFTNPKPPTPSNEQEHLN